MIELKLEGEYGNKRMIIRRGENGNLEVEIMNYKNNDFITTTYELNDDSELLQLKKVLEII